MRHLGLDLHRALRGTGCCDGLARQRGEAADLELVFFMPVAAPDLAGRHRVRSGGAGEAVDGIDQIGRGQIEHAFAGANHVLGGFGIAGEA
jgi:hypothetical protein